MGFEKPFSGLEKESSYLYGPFYVRPRVSWKVDACWVSICNWESHLNSCQRTVPWLLMGRPKFILLFFAHTHKKRAKQRIASSMNRIRVNMIRNYCVFFFKTWWLI